MFSTQLMTRANREICKNSWELFIASAKQSSCWSPTVTDAQPVSTVIVWGPVMAICTSIGIIATKYWLFKPH